MNQKNVVLALAAVAVVVATLSMPAAAKPLYITVNRAFSPVESPVVDVAFAEQGPVQLRVLQPKDLEKYLAKQENLRRAWDKPPTLDNPGRALSVGFNAMRTPGKFLLFSLNTQMRVALGDVLAEREAKERTTHADLALGAKKLVGVPADMALVSQQWLNLDLGGGDRAFDVPGFSGWSSTSSGFQERRVRLKPLPAGVYVLQLVQGNVEGQVVLVVTDLSVQVKQTDHKILVRVASSAQTPVADAAITVRRAGGKPLTAKTDSKGEAFIDVDEPQLLITAQRPAGAGTDTAIVDTEFFSTLAASADVFLYTDRPIYRSGDDVQFRGIARQPDGFLSRLFSPKNRSVTVQLVNVGDNNSVVATTVLTIDALGSFNGELHCPDGATEGVYRVQAVLDGAPHVGEVRVQEYVKPTFFLELQTASDSVAPGGTIKATVKAERYAGGAPNNTAYEVTLTRTSLEAPTWVDDAGLGGEGSKVTYGSSSTTEGKLSVPERLYSTVADRLNAGTADSEDTWKSAPLFADDGTVSIEVPVPALNPGEERLPFRYTLSVRARDDQGTFAASSAPLFLSPVDVMGSTRFSAAVVKAGATAELTVRSTSLGGKAAPKTSGTVAFFARDPRGDERELSTSTITTDDDGKATLEIPTKTIGAVIARVTLLDAKKATWTGEQRLLVVGERGEAVEWVPELVLTTLGGSVAPGDTVDVIAMLPDEWGPGGKAKGPLWITLGGTTIFETKLIDNAEGHTVVIPVDIAEEFGSAVYVSVGYPTRSGRWEERTVPFRIVPRERVLNISVVPTMAEAEPLGEQTVRLRVTDHRGRGVVAQVSLGVVDKAVYAVQAEFRPKAVDFFYPLVRNNVANFFSAEFQGYGYGHQLARRFSDDGVRFAAVKPPKKKADERDTAYWNGSVLTDDSGAATVTFRLPSNQTLWTMTAVAADAEGRVGEGLGQFATRGKSTLQMAAPQFLRVGDTATAMARFSRGKDSDFKGSLNVSASASGALTAKVDASTVDLAGASERVVPVALSATTSGPGNLALRVSGGPSGLLDNRSIDVEEAVVADTVLVSKVGGGALALPMLKDAKLTEVELVLQATLFDAALADLRELLVYPYGCLEQLVASTAPSLALVNALEALKTLDQLTPETKALLVEGRSRANNGVQRILANARPGGGFSWYGADSSSVEMTVLALSGLVPAVKAGLVSARDLRVSSSVAWLEAQNDLSPQLDAWRIWVIANHDPKRAQARVRAALSSSSATTLDPLTGALIALAADAAGLAKEAGTAEQVKALAVTSRAAFVGANVAAGNADDTWRLPLFATGRQAVLGNAARLDGGDVNALKARYLALYASEGLSTLDRATLIQHSLWLVVAEAKTTAAMKPPTVVGAGTVTFARRGAGLIAMLTDGTASVTVSAFDGVATLRARRTVPADSAPAVADGFKIERKYWSIGSGTPRAIAVGGSVAQGDLVWVQLVVDLNGAPLERSAYSVVEDFIPAGFSPLREDKEFRGAPLSLALTPTQLRQRTFSPRKVAFFLEESAWWMGSARELGYVMRADFAGTFIAPPATAQDMYRQSAHARTTSSSLTITPSANGR